jgi:hypothetical protein
MNKNLGTGYSSYWEPFEKIKPGSSLIVGGSQTNHNNLASLINQRKPDEYGFKVKPNSITRQYSEEEFKPYHQRKINSPNQFK